jgi:hypothetical protein
MDANMTEPPLFDLDVGIRQRFQGLFAGRENGFVDAVKSFRGYSADDTSSRDRDQ